MLSHPANKFLDLLYTTVGPIPWEEITDGIPHEHIIKKAEFVFLAAHYPVACFETAFSDIINGIAIPASFDKLLHTTDGWHGSLCGLEIQFCYRIKTVQTPDERLDIVHSYINASVDNMFFQLLCAESLL